MTEEIKYDNNCIIKAFENNPISIIQDETDKKYFFKASDVGKVLNIVNIRTSIMNFDDHERVFREAYDPQGTLQNTIFLSSQGVYRLLYNSKKEIAKKFRKWVGNILDDIIFNNSVELKKQLEKQEQKLLETQLLLEEKKKQLTNLQRLKAKKYNNRPKRDCIYSVKIDKFVKLGKTKNIKDRESKYLNYQLDDIFYVRNCHNCDLAEKVIHHIADKYREENNKEYFNISNELAIYMIDIVCDFLDNFIDFSEKLPTSNLKENLSESLDIIKDHIDIDLDEIVPTLIKPTIIQKTVNIETCEDVLKRFVSEYCELDESYYVLSFELLGAYRLWSRGFSNKNRTQFTKFMKKYYKSKSIFYKEYDGSRLLTYLGIRPKPLIVERESDDILPKYEEFVLTECKYNYTYRISSTNFSNSYIDWCKIKYPEYTFTSEEKTNMEAYINRHFLRDRINMPGYKNVSGIWGFQLKSNNSLRIGINRTQRKEVVKINSTTKEIIQVYQSVTVASEDLNLDIQYVRNSIKLKRLIDNFILQYKDDIEIIDDLDEQIN